MDGSEQMNVEELIGDGRFMKEENEKAEVIKDFWEEISGMSEPEGPSDILFGDGEKNNGEYG